MPEIANAVICGEGMPNSVCLVYPDYAFLSKYARENGLPKKPAELAKDRRFQECVWLQAFMISASFRESSLSW